MASTDQQQRYVRVTDRRLDGFVEFDFSVGDPELYVELILPQAAFQEFCRANRVEHLSEAAAQRVDMDRKKWREAGL
ncbi:phenol hydroxylase subunit [Alkalilimnicola sp. S0819]|uniref:phenol hydroxylase subunit n=1 Tax=Alkalilimnicola sp. S0819 TaxID=2613922 RepID=UPI0012624164|nr:phenol hydroxylase subunit [Alkalilimnicola sp. S0819]KAB7627381.1 phenol hydroxylase [Alkalilimnicola sp. S0819]MPQ16100.1 phenol hydroxylase [Alkalilimnicola sp. S0819]